MLLVATYNTHKMTGLDRRFDPARIAHVIADLGADVVALQEVDRRFGTRTGLLDLDLIRERAGLVPVPASDEPGGHGWHGNALLVRPGTPVLRIDRVRLPGLEPRGALVADLVLSGRTVRVAAVHLGLLPGCRARQARRILAAMHRGPALVLGDFNEPRAQGSALAEMAPAFSGALPGPSFPAALPLLRLDRILGGGGVRPVRCAAHATAVSRLASDHLPVSASLRFL